MPVGHVVFVVSALDPDTAPAVTFSFTAAGNPDSAFNIDRFSGRITLAKELDHETISSYMIRVTANDTVNHVSSSLLLVVQDENDNAPIFTQSNYEVTFSIGYAPSPNYPSQVPTDPQTRLRASSTFDVIDYYCRTRFNCNENVSVSFKIIKQSR